MHETNRKEVYAVTAGGREGPGASRGAEARTGVSRASHRYRTAGGCTALSQPGIKFSA